MEPRLIQVVLLAVLGACTLLFLVETVLYFARTEWYYRLGPALVREEWNTAVPPATAAEAVGRALAGSGLAWRSYGDFFALRRPWWAGSFWPRVTLQVVPGAGGAILVYRVSPFLTAALMALPMLIPLALGGVDAFFGVRPLPLLLIVAGYGAFWYWEVRKLARLEPLRRGLTGIGLRVCTACGYDLHRLEPDRPCPECGGVAR